MTGWLTTLRNLGENAPTRPVHSAHERARQRSLLWQPLLDVAEAAEKHQVACADPALEWEWVKRARANLDEALAALERAVADTEETP